MGKGAGGLKKFFHKYSGTFCFALDRCCNLESQWSMYLLMIIGVSWFVVYCCLAIITFQCRADLCTPPKTNMEQCSPWRFWRWISFAFMGDFQVPCRSSCWTLAGDWTLLRLAMSWATVGFNIQPLSKTVAFFGKFLLIFPMIFVAFLSYLP